MAVGMTPRTFRFPVELDMELKGRAVRESRSESDVVRDALRAYLGGSVVRPGPEPNGAPSRTGSSETGRLGEQVLLDVARWLSEKTGRPYAVCQGLVLAGRVQVNGEPVVGLHVPADRLDGAPAILGG